MAQAGGRISAGELRGKSIAVEMKTSQRGRVKPKSKKVSGEGVFLQERGLT